MAQQDLNLQEQQFENESSNFDLMDWALKILSYWYLFIIAAIIAYGFAYYQNRKWKPQYLSSGTVIIKDNGGSYGSQALMSGFGVDGGYRNMNNQIIMLQSNQLIGRTIDSLPHMQVDYMRRTRLKVKSMYGESPFEVIIHNLRNNAYFHTYCIELQNNGNICITTDEEDNPFKIESRLGEKISCDMFDITVMPTNHFYQWHKLYFRFRSRDDLVSDFKGRLSLHFVNEQSTVLSLSLVSETPGRDCDFLDKLAEVYLQDNLDRKNKVADNSIRFINEQLALLQESLVVSEGEMTDFRQKNKFVDVGSYAGSLMGKMEAYDQETMQLRLKETYLDYLTNYLQTNMEGGGIIVPATLGLDNGMLAGLVQQLNDLQIQRGELSEKNVYYAKYTKDIDNVKSAIREVINSMRESLDIEKKDLDERYQLVIQQVRGLPQKELEMVAIERNYRIDDNYYTFFLQKRAEAEIQKASNMPDNDILDKAETVAVVNSSQKTRNTTTDLLIGLLIPLAFIIITELLNNKIRTPKEAEQISQFPLIGTLRHVRNENPTLVASHPRSSYAEMLRTIRTQIEFIVQRKTNIVITITSTQSGDGKTFLSTNMASLYAMTGKRVLLIDMDIRKPNIHDKLGLDNGVGVTNYLIDECSLSDIILTDTPYDFHIMRAGTIPPNPGELIRSDKMNEMLDLLRKQYDFIIIDSSPIGQVPDANALAEQTDLTLYVIRCLKTNRFFAKNTLHQLYENYSDKIKVILSDIPTERRRFGYGYNSGYSYRSYNYGYGYGSRGYGYGYGYGYGKGKKGKNNYYAEEEE